MSSDLQRSDNWSLFSDTPELSHYQRLNLLGLVGEETISIGDQILSENRVVCNRHCCSKLLIPKFSGLTIQALSRACGRREGPR